MFDFPATPTVGQVYAPAGGPTWQWDGTTWKTSQMQGEMLIQRTFIPGATGSAVTYTYNKPANLRHLEFEGVAAGGSGSSALATGASTWSFGTGGGGGAWGRKLFTAAALPASVLLTIGVPGAASASGTGITASDTTFGSLITLPGGLRGLQGSNTAYTSIGACSGSGYTAYPTGVDVGSPGESSDGSTVGLQYASGAGTWGCIGRAGGSPWGKGYPAQWGTGNNSVAGIGYGWGSSSPFNAASGTLKQSVPGGPGAVLLTEYLAVAPADVTAPARQVFQLGSTGVIVNVPPTAKMAKITGRVLAATQPMYPVMQLSADGTTFLSGGSDYTYGGSILFTGSSASPTKIAPTAQANMPLAPQTDSLTIPSIFDFDLNVAKTVGNQMNGRAHGTAYNSAATTLDVDVFYHSWSAATAILNIAQLPAFRIIPGSGTFAAGSMIVVDWVY